jgi:hypothetical protein
MPRRLVVLAAAGAVLVSATAVWLLSSPSGPRLFPPTASSPIRSSVVIEGMGEASPEDSFQPVGPPRVVPSSATPQASASPSPSTQIQSLGPLAHYQFNEPSGTSAANAVAGGKAATVVGPARFVAGRLGNAIDIGGNGQYVSLPTGVLSGSPEFTVAAWVRLDSIGTWSRVFDFGSGTTTNMFLTPRSGDGTARFAITTAGGGKEQRIDAPAALPVGTWTHVAVTLSGGVGILYLNRAEAARTSGMTLTGASLGNTTQNWIGRSQYQADPYLNGRVDDLRIYGRALTAAEVAALP